MRDPARLPVLWLERLSAGRQRAAER
nr:unnamed protein product [Callosobruchus chinensis]